jgi:hypothetical protein
MAKTLKFKPVAKDRLFYDRWRYCITFTLDEVSCLRELDHDYIDAIIARRRMWREAAHQRWASLNGSLKSAIIPVISGRMNPAKHIITPRHKIITDAMVEDLHELADVLIRTTSEFKIVTSVNTGWIYSNSLTLIKRLNNLACLYDKSLTEAHITRPKNTVVLDNPTHTHRSYFKTVKLTPEEKQNLTNFLTNQREFLRSSPSLIEWSENPFHRLQDYFFIDHTGESWLVMLALVKSGIIRKTVNIIAR